MAEFTVARCGGSLISPPALRIGYVSGLAKKFLPFSTDPLA